MFDPVRFVLSALLATSTLAAMPSVALADVKAGVDAWAAGNYELAVNQWQGPAAAGDPDAQFNYAQAYKLGRGVKRDLTKAESLYASAAAKGHLQAADNYGLLLFQRGERARAMPYVRATADRGDARAQYIYGLALFNGDDVETDWVRAYAYVSLAQQAGLPQAASALTQMDQNISLADRQKSVAVAAQLATNAQAALARQVAAADLSAQPTLQAKPPIAAVAQRDALALPRTPITASTQSQSLAPIAPSATTKKVAPPAKPQRAEPRPPVVTNGPWRLQLGAFGVAGNADALWARVKGRPELAGKRKVLTPVGKLTRLSAVGYETQTSANAACSKLKSSGLTCLVTRD